MPSPLFLAVSIPKVARTPVNTEAMKVGGGSGPGGAVSKQDMEKLIEKATQAAPAQTIRIEQAPLVLSPQPPKPDDTKKA